MSETNARPKYCRDRDHRRFGFEARIFFGDWACPMSPHGNEVPVAISGSSTEGLLREPVKAGTKCKERSTTSFHSPSP